MFVVIGIFGEATDELSGEVTLGVEIGALVGKGRKVLIVEVVSSKRVDRPGKCTDELSMEVAAVIVDKGALVAGEMGKFGVAAVVSVVIATEEGLGDNVGGDPAILPSVSVFTGSSCSKALSIDSMTAMIDFISSGRATEEEGDTSYVSFPVLEEILPLPVTRRGPPTCPWR